MPVHHAAQYNLVAKKLRDRFPLDGLQGTHTRHVITMLAIDFAKSFNRDNENFDPIKFLDQCSPDVDLYPLSELWEGDA